MQPQEIQKIKELIQNSSLLTEAEKKEWLLLLEVMNDKQIAELKDILNRKNLPKVVNNQLKTEVSDLSSEDVMKDIPPLTHIMNLPNTVKNSKGMGVKINKFNKPTISLSSKTSNSSFWQKIKGVLKQKELLAGHNEPTKELLLPSEINVNKDSGVKLAEKKTEMPKLMPKQDDSKILPKISFSPLPSLNPPLPTLVKKIDKPILSNSNEILDLKKDFNLPKLNTFKSASTDLKIEKPFVSGVANTKILIDAKLAKKPETDDTPKMLNKHISFSTLEEISKLTTKDLSLDLVSGFRNLMKIFGYHNFIFSLEKSPLFQSYIHTGIEAFKKDGFVSSSKNIEILNREDFENFIDVLRRIKQ